MSEHKRSDRQLSDTERDKNLFIKADCIYAVFTSVSTARAAARSKLPPQDRVDAIQRHPPALHGRGEEKKFGSRLLLRRHPVSNPTAEDIERERAGTEDLIVELADIEAIAQLLLCVVA